MKDGDDQGLDPNKTAQQDARKSESEGEETSSVGSLSSGEEDRLIEESQSRKEPVLRKPPEPFRNLVFQGGGIKGMVYPGALKELESKNILESIVRVGGTSAGGIFALLVGLGYSADAVEEEIKNLDFQKFKDKKYGTFEKLIPNKDLVIAKLGDMLKALADSYRGKDIGIFRGNLFHGLCQYYLGLVLGNPHATFDDLHQLIESKQYPDLKDIFVTGCKMDDSPHGVNEVYYFNYMHTPQMRIADAVRITMSYPVAFKPFHVLPGIEGVPPGKYQDGGIKDNLPVTQFNDRSHMDSDVDFTKTGSNPQTLCLSIVQESDQDRVFSDPEPEQRYQEPPFGVSKFGMGFKSILLEEKRKIRERQPWVILIPDEGVPTLQMRLNPDKQQHLIHSGTKKAKEFTNSYFDQENWERVDSDPAIGKTGIEDEMFVPVMALHELRRKLLQEILMVLWRKKSRTLDVEFLQKEAALLPDKIQKWMEQGYHGNDNNLGFRIHRLKKIEYRLLPKNRVQNPYRRSEIRVEEIKSSSKGKDKGKEKVDSETEAETEMEAETEKSVSKPDTSPQDETNIRDLAFKVANEAIASVKQKRQLRTRRQDEITQNNFLKGNSLSDQTNSLLTLLTERVHLSEDEKKSRELKGMTCFVKLFLGHSSQEVMSALVQWSNDHITWKEKDISKSEKKVSSESKNEASGLKKRFYKANLKHELKVPATLYGRELTSNKQQILVSPNAQALDALVSVLLQRGQLASIFLILDQISRKDPEDPIHLNLNELLTGMTPNNRMLKQELLLEAVRAGNVELTQLLMEYYEVNPSEMQGCNVLMEALKLKNYNVLNALCKHEHGTFITGAMLDVRINDLGLLTYFAKEIQKFSSENQPARELWQMQEAFLNIMGLVLNKNEGILNVRGRRVKASFGAVDSDLNTVLHLICETKDLKLLMEIETLLTSRGRSMDALFDVAQKNEEGFSCYQLAALSSSQIRMKKEASLDEEKASEILEMEKLKKPALASMPLSDQKFYYRFLQLMYQGYYSEKELERITGRTTLELIEEMLLNWVPNDDKGYHEIYQKALTRLLEKQISHGHFRELGELFTRHPEQPLIHWLSAKGNVDALVAIENAMDAHQKEKMWSGLRPEASIQDLFDPHSKNPAGQTPADVAQLKGNTEFQKKWSGLLEKFGVETEEGEPRIKSGRSMVNLFRSRMKSERSGRESTRKETEEREVKKGSHSERRSERYLETKKMGDTKRLFERYHSKLNKIEEKIESKNFVRKNLKQVLTHMESKIKKTVVTEGKEDLNRLVETREELLKRIRALNAQLDAPSQSSAPPRSKPS